ncbi:dihydropteroate synthase [Desertibaculum subflavum]|uniref:dihydropteroate synthase n=1 Tax=Desertibaculum subflavum TaxID=2268458 RepID=UPI000E661993
MTHLTFAGVALDRPRLLGIVNVTPDSFSDGGRFFDAGAAIAHGAGLVEDGADLLDIGGESTRPGSQGTPAAEQLARVLPVIEGLKPLGRPLSIDTRDATVMREAVAAGAAIVNDVTGLTHDPAALAAVAATKASVILCHSRGEPATMQQHPRYGDVVAEVRDALAALVARAEAAGIARTRLAVDPGIGFGKTPAHNLALLRRLDALAALGLPVLIGASRKGFIGRLTGVEAADRRVAGSVAAALWAAEQGARLLRVHDVAETRQALAIWAAIEKA